jgi:glycosyltransferase involved in cell wall biosynthesis
MAPRRVVNEAAVFVFSGPGGERVFDLFSDEAALVAFAIERGVRRVLVNHLIDLPASAGGWIAAFAEKLGATYEVLLHDYFLACPRVDLIDSAGRYCRLADVARCAGCLAKSGPALAGIDPAAWRRQSEEFLVGAAAVTAPSQDLARRLGQVFPAVPIGVWEPEAEEGLIRCSNAPTLAAAEALRIVVLGALNRPKGLDVVVGLARTLKRRKAPVSITLIGPTADPRPLRRAGVQVHGVYTEADLPGLLDAARPHLILFPAIWPETWSFTLTEALRTPAEIVAFDIGAIAERLKRMGRGRVLPYALHDDPDALADAIQGIRRDLAAMRVDRAQQPADLGADACGET